MKVQECSNCRFYIDKECRVNPPKITVGSSLLRTRTDFPKPAPDKWCGSWDTFPVTLENYVV